MEKQKYYLTDQETGDKIEVSKSQYDSFQAAVSRIKTKRYKGTMVVAGTGSDPIYDRMDVKELWNNI